MHQPIEMNLNADDYMQPSPKCPLTPALSPVGGEGDEEMTRAPKNNRRVERKHARFTPLAVDSVFRLHASAKSKCHRSPLLLAVGLSIVLLAGCAVGPNYSRPTVPAQAAWKERTIATNA